MYKRKLKRGLILKVLIIFISLLLIISLYNALSYLSSENRKLKKHGYSDEEIKIISKLDQKFLDEIYSRSYSEHIPHLISEKYFIESKFDEYLELLENNTYEYSDVIAIVNTNNHIEHYEKIYDSNVELEKLMLVNRYYKLSSDYTGIELSDISVQYAFDNNKLNLDALNNFIRMHEAAKNEGYTLIANGSYRSYESQEIIYERSRSINGTRRTDEIIARPGHSEHQTGLALDIQILGRSYSSFDETEEFDWLINNSHKYGFILRYPKDKEHLTGFKYEAWHYRYVGQEVATYIFENEITFDEYYAFYIEHERNN